MELHEGEGLACHLTHLHRPLSTHTTQCKGTVRKGVYINCHDREGGQLAHPYHTVQGNSARRQSGRGHINCNDRKGVYINSHDREGGHRQHRQDGIDCRHWRQPPHKQELAVRGGGGEVQWVVGFEGSGCGSSELGVEFSLSFGHPPRAGAAFGPSDCDHPVMRRQ